MDISKFVHPVVNKPRSTLITMAKGTERGMK